jgi:hypothetical protein
VQTVTHARRDTSTTQSRLFLCAFFSSKNLTRHSLNDVCLFNLSPTFLQHHKRREASQHPPRTPAAHTHTPLLDIGAVVIIFTKYLVYVALLHPTIPTAPYRTASRRTHDDDDDDEDGIDSSVNTVALFPAANWDDLESPPVHLFPLPFLPAFFFFFFFTLALPLLVRSTARACCCYPPKRLA